jgi:putative transposase
MPSTQALIPRHTALARAQIIVPYLTPEEVRELVAAAALMRKGERDQRTHSETGLAPQARWEAGGFLPHLPESLETLDLLLLTVAKTRRVQQDGIRFEGFRYIDLTLAAYVGEHVTIRYDPRAMAEIRIFHQDVFICRAVCQDLAGQTISLKEIVAARRRRQQALHSLTHTIEDLLAQAAREAGLYNCCIESDVRALDGSDRYS